MAIVLKEAVCQEIHRTEAGTVVDISPIDELVDVWLYVKNHCRRHVATTVREQEKVRLDRATFMEKRSEYGQGDRFEKGEALWQR